jgi:hypothetical protein
MTRGGFVMQQRARPSELDQDDWNDRFGANWEEAMTDCLWAGQRPLKEPSNGRRRRDSLYLSLFCHL